MVLWSERRLIEEIRQGVQQTGSGLITAIGDDCCEILANGSWLISTDTLVDSVHFDRSFHSPHLLGRKSIAVNLSDIAAMGGKSRFVQLSLCLPHDLQEEWISSFMGGVFEILQEHDTVLSGGDTVKGREMVITVTVFGEPCAGGAIYRNGAKTGDTVWVSGSLGSAGCGLELLLSEKKWPGKINLAPFQKLIDVHLNPLPLLPLGQSLVSSGLVTAMQDVSDGLATDLAHICLASGCAANIQLERLPVLPELEAAAIALQRNREDLILRSGEDYQLVFTVAGGQEGKFSRWAEGCGHPLRRIGEISSGSGLFLESERGREDISFQGYQH